MYRLKEDFESELEIKKSRFLTYLHKSFDEQDAKDYILTIKKLHPNATHHCYAFILGEQDECQRSNDDGEPSGTAGAPMLECLAHQQMHDIVAITVRYFGGIKLGAGGLIRAYSKSVSTALAKAPITQKKAMKKCSLTFSYDLVGKIDYYMRTHGLDILQKDYEDMVRYVFLCEQIPESDLSEISAGAYLPTFLEDVIIEVQVKKEEEIQR